MDLLPYFLMLGAVAGILAGLLGVGGGLVIVPALAWMFRSQGFADTLIMQLAVGTSLATIIVTSISSVRAHHQRGAVLWPVLWRLAPGIIIGAWCASAVALGLSSDLLRTVFGVFVLVVAVQMAFAIGPRSSRPLPGALGQGLAGWFIGFVSALVGIGGGILTVPYLVAHQITAREAVATSAGCGLPIALAGTLGYIAAGWGHGQLPPGSTGFVYWPAVAGIVAASAMFAPLGARLAHSIPAAALKRVFAGFLALVAVRMVFF